MKKRMLVMLICVAILFGAIFIFKAIKSYMIKQFLKANAAPIVWVSTMKVGYDYWQPKMVASGSLRALLGVNVTTELAGMVTNIYVSPGAYVKKGEVLVQLNANNEIGVLNSLIAQEKLAEITYNRDKAQFAAKAISKQQLDTDIQNLKNLNAQVFAQNATVKKKTIVAAFTGRIGVVYVFPGQYLNPGDTVASLQTLNPIWADFYLPQQALAQLKLGLVTHVTADASPGKTYTGQITTIEPNVDVATRNVLVEATINNPKYELAPGMFVNVEVLLGSKQRFLTLPQTVVTFNPFGDIVYIVEDNGKDEQGKPNLTVKQAFVITGETRGEQVTILKGLKEGDTVVTSGQLKLKNGSRIAVNNSIVPSNNAKPKAPNEY